MKEKTMTSDAVKATEETFANAFVDSCKINPAYNAWKNNIAIIPTEYQFNWQKDQCDTRYETVM